MLLKDLQQMFEAADELETLMNKNANDGKSLQEIQNLRRIIIMYTNEVNDELLRRILILRHVSGLDWNQIAYTIGKGVTEKNVREVYDRFIESVGSAE